MVCKSVHHRTIQINHQPSATVFHFIILTFVYSSTCFGRFPAHHQEPNYCCGSLWFYLRIVVTVVLCSWSGRPARPARPRTQHDKHNHAFYMNTYMHLLHTRPTHTEIHELPQ
jgi:hypothetical protein